MARSGRRVHSGSHEFIGVCNGVAWYNRDCVGSLGRPYWSPVSFGFVYVRLGSPRCPRAHSGLPGFTWARIGVAGFVRVRSGSFGFTQEPVGVSGFIGVREV